MMPIYHMDTAETDMARTRNFTQKSEVSDRMTKYIACSEVSGHHTSPDSLPSFTSKGRLYKFYESNLINN